MVLGMLFSSTCYFLRNDFKFAITIVALDIICKCFSSVSTTLIFSCCHIWEPSTVLILILIYVFVKLIFYCWCRHGITSVNNGSIRLSIRFILCKLLFPSKSRIGISTTSKVGSFFRWIPLVLIVKVIVVFVCLVVSSIVIWGHLVTIVVVIIIVVSLWLLIAVIVIVVVVLLTTFHFFVII